MHIEENIGFIKIFDFRFVADLHVLGGSEHDFTISGKCLSLCASDKNFLENVTREIIHRISRNFTFRIILTYIDVYQLLVNII